ncbi:MAG: hypothetical protein QGF12_08115 [SAR202 cluster bacterium]|nr:hypothetical protein [SAR202 cluster bacterium]
MKAKKKVAEKGNADSQQPGRPLKFKVDYDAGGGAGVSIALLIASRKCYECRQNDIEPSVAQSAPTIQVKRISQHCFKTADYLLPDTPLKEAVFRVLLSKRNRAISAEEISADLAKRWGQSINRREVSAGVIGRLLEDSPYYHTLTKP